MICDEKINLCHTVQDKTHYLFNYSYISTYNYIHISNYTVTLT